MKEIVVISGKGGTGKTSIVASFAALAGKKAVLADCDVDAADLHLVLEPQILTRETFVGGKKARIKHGHCLGCGECVQVCRFDAIDSDGPGNGRVGQTFRVDPLSCEGCGVCVHFCPEQAIEFAPAPSGQWFVSETRFGPMVHARLAVAAENSGKLVSLVRIRAKQIADERNCEFVLIDGSPGIGCPVIASITGADMVVIVTEPTRSALHDLDRVVDLTRHFGVSAFVCINKWDLNEELTAQIESRAREQEIPVVGRIRYDTDITKAQIRKQSVIEYQTEGAADDVLGVWRQITSEAVRTKTGFVVDPV